MFRSFGLEFVKPVLQNKSVLAVLLLYLPAVLLLPLLHTDTYLHATKPCEVTISASSTVKTISVDETGV